MDKEKQRARYKKYYQKNRERIKLKKKLYGREYRKKNIDLMGEKWKEYKKEWQKKNKDKIRIKKRIYSQKIKENFLLKYKLGKYCSFCGYNEHPEILQFHHKNRKDKSFRISEFRRTPNLLLLNEEINKCILLCPNCHYLFHLKERKKEIDNG